MKSRLLILFLLTITSYCAYAQKTITVKGEYLYQLPENVSLEEGKRVALERAKIQALADAFGTVVSQRNSTVVENSNGQSSVDFLSLGGSDVRGEWIETVGEPLFQIFSENGMLAIKVEIKGKAREIKNADVSLEAHLLRNGTTLKYESTEFRSGDDMYLYFKSPVNGFLAVYLLDQVTQEVYCLLPYRSSDSPSYRIEHDKPYIFFSSQLSEDNPTEVDEYTLTCSKSQEQNTIYILFSPNAFTKANTLDVAETLPRQLAFVEFQKWVGKCRTKDVGMQEMIKVLNIKK